MRCPNCGASTLVVAVPPDLSSYAPDESTRIAVCTNCLSVNPTDDETDLEPDFDRISIAVPDDPDASVPLLLMVGLLPRLVIFREEITALLERVERAGVDPLLALRRITDDSSLDPAFDIERRVDQLVQLYE